MSPALLLALQVLATSPIEAAVGPPAPTRLHWSDVDGDGFTDALAVEPGGTLRLLLGDGSGRFVDATTEAGLDTYEGVRAAVLGDWSGDGSDDLVLAAPLGLSFLRFEDNAFVDTTPALGFESIGLVTDLALVDANGDSALDVHVVVDGWHRVFASVPESNPVRFDELDLGRIAASEKSRSTTTDLDSRAQDTLETPSFEPGGTARSKIAPGVGPIGPVPTGGGRHTVIVAGGTTSAAPAAGTYGALTNPVGICAGSLRDQATGNCIRASSVPTLGMLHPLGTEFMIDAVSGFVGVGTTTPGYPLEVAGQIVSGTNNTPTGASSAIGGGTTNNATGEHATIAGGEANQALGDDTFIGGGLSNLIVGQRAVIGGGVGNSASNSAVVGGGEQNTAFNFATVTGGRSNDASAVGSAIGGGANNEASGLNATIAGGGDAADPLLGNTASGIAASVGGGRANNASGDHATVPGGRLNVAAGVDSFAAGRRARAFHDGAFVWADSTDADFTSTAPDQFLVRAAGGVGIGTGAPVADLHVMGDPNLGSLYLTPQVPNGSSELLLGENNVGTFGARILYDGSSNLLFFQGIDGGATTTAMTIKRDSGEVGIGTLDPLEALDVDGNIQSRGTNGGALIARNPNNQNASVNLSWLNDIARIRIGGTGAGATNGLDLQSFGNASLMRVLDNGRVGLGTTAPDVRLHVAAGSDASLGGGGYAVIGNTSSSNLAFDSNEIMARDNGAAAGLNLNADGGNVSMLGNTNDDRVGIGTTTPQERLDVGGNIQSRGTNGGALIARNPNNQNASVNLSWLNDIARIRIGGTGAGATNGLDLQTFGNASLMRVLDNGRVGLGTTAPDVRLHVAAGSDASLGGGGYAVIGNTSSSNLAFDSNEIMARDNGAAAGLNLNADGGNVSMLGNTNDDRVGIGTTTPQERLDVGGNIQSRGTNGGALIAKSPTNQSAFVSLSWLNDNARIRVGGSGVGSTSGLEIQGQGDSLLLNIGGSGDIEVFGAASKPGGGLWSALSDARLKKDVEDLDGALERLLRLRGVTYEFRDPEKVGELRGEHTGFIAQEVEQVFPEWVDERDDGYKQLSIRGFSALTVEALRDLRAEKDAEIDALRSENARLKRRVERLEALEDDLARLRTDLTALLEDR